MEYSRGLTDSTDGGPTDPVCAPEQQGVADSSADNAVCGRDRQFEEGRNQQPPATA